MKKPIIAILMVAIMMLFIATSALPLSIGIGTGICATDTVPGNALDFDGTFVPAETEENPYLVRTFIDEEGRQIDEIIVPGRPPEIKASVITVPEPDTARGINALSSVPAFDWCYGCSATAAAMMFGYYDNADYTNMYAGPTNGGVCPMTNSVWGLGECPLSATHRGYDGLTEKGHVDDYWYQYLSTVDPYYGNWAEHGYADCTADYMGTNQYHNWQNVDGNTWFIFYTDGSPTYDYTLCEGWTPPIRDGCHGTRLFVESRGYNVHHDGSNYQNYNQYIHEIVSGGFTFADFMSEIDAGRPVLIQVTGHTMLGYGYNTAGSKVYIHDTWDHSNHEMTWGGTYGDSQHYGVTVIQLSPCPAESAVYQAGVHNPEGILNPLRELRDDNLKDEYVDRYYDYGPELTMVMTRDPALTFKAARLLVKYSPMVRHHVYGIGVDKQITRRDVREIVSFTDRLKRGVLKNRDEIGTERSQEIIKFLDKFKEQVKASKGKTFSEALQDSIYYKDEQTGRQYGQIH